MGAGYNKVSSYRIRRYVSSLMIHYRVWFQFAIRPNMNSELQCLKVCRYCPIPSIGTSGNFTWYWNTLLLFKFRLLCCLNGLTNCEATWCYTFGIVDANLWLLTVKTFQLQWALAPGPDPFQQGSAPRPRWGLPPQIPGFRFQLRVCRQPDLDGQSRSFFSVNFKHRSAGHTIRHRSE